MKRIWSVIGLWLLLGMLCVPSACAFVPPSRTLPSYIHRIYIREFKNGSRLFGAQADLTLYVNDEFMADGRLDVVQSDRSDVRLEGRIKSYEETPKGSGGDYFPLISRLRMECVVELWDPYDPDRIAPLYRFKVPCEIQYISDPRRSIAETETEAHDRLLRQMAKNIVNAVMTGTPAPRKPLEQKKIEKYQARRGAGKYNPIMTQPRYPKPTPAPRRHMTREEE